MDDQDMTRMVVQWAKDGRVMSALILSILALVAVNILLCWRLFRQRNDNETVIEWAQDMSEVEVTIPWAEGMTRKDVNLRIMPTTLKLTMKGYEQPVLQGTLFRKVRSDDCNWQLWPVGGDGPKKMKISLVKAEERQWKSLFVEDQTSGSAVKLLKSWNPLRKKQK